MLFDEITEPPHELATISGRHGGPRTVVKGATSGRYGFIDIASGPVRNSIKNQPGRGVDYVDRAVFGRWDPLAVDEELFLLGHETGCIGAKALEGDRCVHV
jgi:hypothetical protein